MRILADENIAGATVNALRALGHDVLWAGADYEGNSDEDLLAVASRDRRLVLTLDKDFGELAFNRKQPVRYGIILVRIHAAGAKPVTDRLVEVLQTRDDWERHFSVVESGRIRVVPLVEEAEP